MRFHSKQQQIGADRTQLWHMQLEKKVEAQFVVAFIKISTHRTITYRGVLTYAKRKSNKKVEPLVDTLCLSSLLSLELTHEER